MKRKSILLDLDDVICIPDFLYLLNKFMGTNYTFEDIDSYYLDDVVGDRETKLKLNEFYYQHNLYEHAEFLPKAYEIIKKLNEQYDIYVCTAGVPLYLREKAGRCFMDKYNYLITKLPFLDPEKFIFTNSKGLIKVDIQIDDKLSNLENDIPTKILFTSYHNTRISDEELKEKGVIRANDWLDIADILLDNKK